MLPPTPSRGRFHRFALAGVIAGFVAIVVGPPLATYFPMEVAKWYLAAAQQSLNKAEKPGDQQIQEAQRLLERATSFDPGIVNSDDYFRIRLTMRPNDIWPGFVDRIRGLEPEARRNAVLRHASFLAEGAEYAAAMRLIEAIFAEPTDRDAELNNLFAYVAAEADENLDAAAASIELSLAQEENSAFLDTQAWVLYRRRQFDAALPVMQRAIRERYREFRELPAGILDGTEVQRLQVRVERIREDDVLSHYAPEDLLTLLRDGELSAPTETPVEPPTNAPIEANDEGAATQELDATDSPADGDAEQSTSSGGDVSSAEPLPPRTLSDLAVQLGKTLEPLPNVTGTGDQATRLFKEFAIFRYHRAEIIRELGHPDIAALEYEYLRANGIEDPSKLH